MAEKKDKRGPPVVLARPPQDALEALAAGDDAPLLAWAAQIVAAAQAAVAKRKGKSD